MRKDPHTFREVDGLWDSDTGTIIIKRKTLKSIASYSGTLIHEVAHCLCGREDVNREFELELTSLIGILTTKLLKFNSN